MLYRNPKFEAIHTTELDQSKVYITAGVLKSSSNATLAICFVHYLQSTVGRLHFTEQGYNPVDNAIEKTHLNIPQKTSSIR